MGMNDMSDLLRSTGVVGFAEAASAVAFAFMTPNSTDPGMAPVKTIIRAIQTALNRGVAAGLTVDGIMGPQTSTALRRVVPPAVTDLGTTKWYELLQFAVNAKPAAASPLSLPAAIAAPLQSGLSNPWIIGGGLALLYLLTRKSSKRRG
jgi:hypothetical protein